MTECRGRPTRLAALIAVCSAFGCLTSAPEPTGRAPLGSQLRAPGDTVALNQDLTAYPVFPEDNWWNLDVSAAPLDPQSDAFITWIGESTRLHPDFGPPPYGMPYIVVPGNQPKVMVTWTLFGFQSDDGPPGQPPGYPIPDEAFLFPNFIEGGLPGGGTSGDRHMLIIDRDNWLLYETWRTQYNDLLGRWEAGSGAVFDMNNNRRRPERWTSADAAGLAIFPGLIRYDEVYGPGKIDHAFRVTFTHSNGYVWPASHVGGAEPEAMPLGTRLRLKASCNISGFPPPARKILRAMKTYGLIFADNGSDLYIQGTMDPRWDSEIINPAFQAIRAEDLEVIQRGWSPHGRGAHRQESDPPRPLSDRTR